MPRSHPNGKETCQDDQNRFSKAIFAVVHGLNACGSFHVNRSSALGISEALHPPAFLNRAFASFEGTLSEKGSGPPKNRELIRASRHLLVRGWCCGFCDSSRFSQLIDAVCLAL